MCTFVEWIMLLLLCLLPLVAPQTVNKPPKPNLLFFMAESVRPDDFILYNGPASVAPNLDKLFARPGSIAVNQAHVQYPLCNPSRTSIMLGRRPDVTGVKTNYLDWHDTPNSENWVSLPKLLLSNGWYTTSGGKVFHRGTNDIDAWANIFDTQDDINELECQEDDQEIPVPMGLGENMPTLVGCRTPSTQLPDLIIARNAVKEITRIAKYPDTKQPFAMFVGFHLPHYPIRIANQYQINRKVLNGVIPPEEPPRNVSEFSNDLSFISPKPKAPNKGIVRDSDPFRQQVPASVEGGTVFTGKGPLAAYRTNFRWLHFSGISQMDAGAGSVLDALDENGFTDSTLIVYLSDHGVGLGETRLWEKDMPLDIATRVPLVFTIPWLQYPSLLTSHDFIMDALDVYRTVASLLGVSDKVGSEIEGRDMSDYLTGLLQASSEGNKPSPPVSYVGFSQVVRCSNVLKCNWDMKGMDLLGYTVRTSKYRYVAYLGGTYGVVNNWTYSNVVSEELYDHTADSESIYNASGSTFVGHEMVNIAPLESDTTALLFEVLRARFVDGNYSLALMGSTTPPSLSPSHGNVQQTLAPLTRSPSARTAKPATEVPTRLSQIQRPTASPWSTEAPSIKMSTLRPSSSTDDKSEAPTFSQTRQPSYNNVTRGDSTEDINSISTGAVVAATVIPIVIFILLLVPIVVLCLRKRRARQENFSTPQEKDHESSGSNEQSVERSTSDVKEGDVILLPDSPPRPVSSCQDSFYDAVEKGTVAIQ